MSNRQFNLFCQKLDKKMNKLFIITILRLPFFILTIIILSSCTNHNDGFITEYMQIHKDINFKTVSFDSLKLYNHQKIKTKDLFASDKKKIIVIGRMDCSTCILKLKEIEKYKQDNNIKTEIFYIALGKDNQYFRYQVKENNFSFHILSDYNNYFIKHNGLEDYAESFFILNNNNKIIFTGSPLNNQIISKYYKKLISE